MSGVSWGSIKRFERTGEISLRSMSPRLSPMAAKRTPRPSPMPGEMPGGFLR